MAHCFLLVPDAFSSEEAVSDNKPAGIESLYQAVSPEWGGQLRLRSSLSWHSDDSVYSLVGTEGPYYDASVEFRLKNTLYFGDWGVFETHYEAVLSGFDTRRKTKALEALFPDLIGSGLMPPGKVNDRRRLMNLTATLSEDDGHVLYHRLDRLVLTTYPSWGTVRVGRQAVTWGNGLIFNPMDLFNPFSPTDILRDYKVGDDMITAQMPVGSIGAFNFLYLPRRDPVSGDAEWWDESSLAGRFHFAVSDYEFDIMAAHHFDDTVLGIGSTGYLGGAAWRLDALWTFLNEKGNGKGFFSLVANVDYSWVWWEKNFYGLIEFYYNGVGKGDYTDALFTDALVERIQRGEVFTIGRYYLAGSVQIELHPLLNLHLTAIANMADPSGILQPRAVWDVTQNIQLTAGGNIYWGRDGTEFGGVRLPEGDLLLESPLDAFVWLTYYF